MTCQRHMTFMQAHSIVLGIRERKDQPDWERVRTIHCPRCKAWGITTKPRTLRYGFKWLMRKVLAKET